MSNGLERINRASTTDAESMFRNCCGSAKWAARMASSRPFKSDDELFITAAAIWNDLIADDWLEAVSAHPKIGEKKATQQKQSAKWSAGEQAGIYSADDLLKRNLANANAASYDKF